MLRLPEPKSKKYVSQKRMISENLEFPTKKKQREYFEPKFQRLSQVLNDPRLVENWTPDPSSIAPERALVFEIASSALDFEQAIRRVNGLEWYCGVKSGFSVHFFVENPSNVALIKLILA